MAAIRVQSRRRRVHPPRVPYAWLAAVVGILLLTRADLLPRGDDGADSEPSGPPAGERARVVRVHDGDTLTVDRQAGRRRIRIFGIDCPEHGQPGGDAARRLTERLTAGREVRLDVVDTDRLGRLVARVRVGDQDLAAALLAAGLAWHFRRYSDDPTYQAAEDAAREARRGVWAATRPTAPWEWRREHPVAAP